MRLPRSIGVVVAGLVAVSCGDSTAPPERVNALYVLESIGGQPLPATFAADPLETATVFWATLNLDPAGNATLAERRRSVWQTSQQERTIAIQTDYEIIGEDISIGPPCRHHPLALCVPKRVGKLQGQTLTLRYDFEEPHLTYTYRLAVGN
ncbi:MAG TPA: hypothetical protein VNO75_06210 [Gemmatimonadaceae bacterium]|nr:hypothetical protein [Gemmatimonadaceae bacterium]